MTSTEAPSCLNDSKTAPFADQPYRLHDQDGKPQRHDHQQRNHRQQLAPVVITHSSTDPFPEDPKVGCVAGRRWVRRSRTGSVDRCVPGDFHSFLAFDRIVVEVLGRRW